MVSSANDSARLQELPDLWVALRPKRAFQTLREQAHLNRGWQAAQRPLLVAFVIGCAMTLIASAPFHPWLMLSTTTYWSLVPLAEILGLLVAIRMVAIRVVSIRAARNAITLPRLIDLYFTGHAPWLVWFTGLSIYWSLLSPAKAGALVFTPVPLLVLLSVTILALLWSIYIDVCFFRIVLDRSAARAYVAVLLQRFVSWSLIIGVYTYGAFWEEVVRLVGP